MTQVTQQIPSVHGSSQADHLTQHAWAIRNTFIELVNEGGGDEDETARCVSDNEGLASLKSRESSDDEKRAQQIAAAELQEWHKTWSSSSEKSSRGSGKASPWGVRQASKRSVQQKYACEESDHSCGSDCKEIIPNGDPDFDLQGALELYTELQPFVDSGMDVRDVIAESYSHLNEGSNIKKFVVRDDDGQKLSLGSVQHLLAPIGTICRPCEFHRRGKCYRGEQCFYCHFWHTRKQSRREARSNKTDTSPAKQRRDRRKRCAARAKQIDQADATDSDDDEAYNAEVPPVQQQVEKRFIISL